MGKDCKPKPSKGPVSLDPLTPEQALKGLLSIPEPEKAIEKAGKPKRKERPPTSEG